MPSIYLTLAIAALVGVIVGILVREGIDVVDDWREDRAYPEESPSSCLCRGCYYEDGQWHEAHLDAWYCDECADERNYSGMTRGL